MKVFCDISYYETEQLLGWAYYALEDDGTPVFRFPRTGARFMRVKKCWETEVKKLIVRQFPEAEIMSDHVDGPLGGTKVDRHHPTLLICHYAAKQAALAKIRRNTNIKNGIRRKNEGCSCERTSQSIHRKKK